MFGWFKKRSPELTPVVSETPITYDYDNPDAIIAYFKSETGVTFEKQRDIVRRKLETFCRLRDIVSFSSCLQSVSHDAGLRQELINALTTNESYFFREYAQIEQMAAIAKNLAVPINILCAPCATGEEPYSIVIALLEAGLRADTFRVVGIDINTQALERARQGRYGERSVRNIPEALRQKYFTCHSNNFEISERIISQVIFKNVNLFDPEFLELGTFDLIFSRNMLIYFDDMTRVKARTILESMRKDPGIGVFFGHADLF